jgi:hypothetical protein
VALRSTLGQCGDDLIEIAPEQYAAAVGELQFEAQVDAALGVGQRLAEAELDQPAVIGTTTRRAVEAEVRRLEALVGSTRELARFRPLAGRLAAITPAVTRHCLDLALGLLDALVAPDLETAMAAQATLDRLSADDAIFIEFRSELEAASSEETSTDSRIANALGRPGHYCDELDIPDAAQILGAFAAEEQPFPAMTRAGGAYLRPLLHTPPDALPPHGAFLVLPAAIVASLATPHEAFRVARATIALLHQAAARDPDTVARLIRRGIEQQALILGAQARIRRDLTLLALAEREGLEDDADVISRLVVSYKRVLETSYRMVGHLVLDLGALGAGRHADIEEDPPRLAEIESALRVAPDPGPALASAVDRDLRNAEAHEQYRYDVERETVEDLRTGVSWPLEVLISSIESLIAVIAGVDAGCSCYIVDEDLDLEDPAAATSPLIAELIVRAGFGGYGWRVQAVDLAAGVVKIDADTAPWDRLIPPVAGAAQFLAGERLVVRGHESTELLSVARTTLEEARDAEEDVKQLAIFAPLTSAALARGAAEADVYASAAAAQITVVAGENMKALAGGEDEQTIFARIRKQLAYVTCFAGLGGDDHRLDRAQQIAADLDALAARALTGDPSARNQLIDQLVNAVSWAEGVRDLALFELEDLS